MATDLTGLPLSDVYSSFLHTDTVTLTSGLLGVYNGVGEQSALSISSSAVGVNGAFICNNIQYPTAPGEINMIPVMSSGNTLQFRTLQNVLTSTQVTPVQDGVYSSPRITFVDGLVSNVQNTGATKIFFINSRVTNQPGPNLIDLVNFIQWNSQPTTGDIAFVMQKVVRSTGDLADIDIHKFIFDSSSGWGSYTKF